MPSTPRTAARLVAAGVVLLALAAGVLHVVMRTMPVGSTAVIAAPDVVEQPCEGGLCDQQQVDDGMEVTADQNADACDPSESRVLGTCVDAVPPAAPKVIPAPVRSRPAARAASRPRTAVPVAVVRRDDKDDKKKDDKKKDSDDKKKSDKKDKKKK